MIMTERQKADARKCVEMQEQLIFMYGIDKEELAIAWDYKIQRLEERLKHEKSY